MSSILDNRADILGIVDEECLLGYFEPKEAYILGHRDPKFAKQTRFYLAEHALWSSND